MADMADLTTNDSKLLTPAHAGPLDLNFDVETIDPAKVSEGEADGQDSSGQVDLEPQDKETQPQAEQPEGKVKEAAATASASAEAAQQQPAQDGTEPAEQSTDQPASGEASATAQPAEKGEEESLELPPGTTPKAAENFAKLKAITARERELRIEAERRAAEAEAKLKAARGLPPEVEAELKALRAKVAEVDVNFAPEVQVLDKELAENEAAITDICSAYPNLAKVVSSVKKIGSWRKAAEDYDLLEKLAPVLKPADRLAVEQLLGNSRQLEVKRARTVQSLVENFESVKAQREQQARQEQEQLINEALQLVEQKRKATPWLAVSKIDPKDGPEVKKAKEEHNKFIAELEADLKEKLNVDGRTILTKLASMAFEAVEAKKLRRDLDAANARISELEKTLADVRKAGTIQAKPASSAPAKQAAPTEVDWEGLLRLDVA
jgi:hypothetical protein